MMVLVLLTSTIILYMLNGYLGFAFQLLALAYYRYENFNKKENFIEIILGMTIISLPTSFINVLGGPYGKLPISWFNIFMGILCVYVMYLFLKKEIKIEWDSIKKSTVVMCIYLIIPVIFAYDKVDALKDYLTIVVSLSLIIGITCFNVKSIDYKKLEKLYILVALATAIALLVQIILSKAFKFDMGMIGYFAGDRTAYGIIFSDYSFLSLYLTSALGIAFINYLKQREKFYSISFIIIMLASVLTTSRTGIVGFIGASLTYIIYKGFSTHREKRKTYLKLFAVVILIAIVVTLIIMKLRPQQNLLSGSGRIAEYMLGFKIFLSKPIFGIGLGADNFVSYIKYTMNLTGYAIPHNFFIIMLLQTGLVGTLISCWLIYNVLRLAIDNEALLVSILTTIIGSQFIPDIFQSRFFAIQIVLIVLYNKKIHEQKNIF